MTVTQDQFRIAIFDPSLPHPEGLESQHQAPAGKRFDVYRNNVIVSLTEALQDSFPVIAKLLGPENFTGLAGQFVRSQPPTDPRMMHFGAAFPDYLENLPALHHLPYLADVARLEIAMRQSYHAADSTPIDPTQIADLSPDDLAETQLIFAPSTRLVRSDWPIYAIWHMNNGGPQDSPEMRGEDVLISRPDFDPIPAHVPRSAAMLFALLEAKMPLGDALERTTALHSAHDFSAFLTLLISTGTIIGLTPKDTP